MVLNWWPPGTSSPPATKFLIVAGLNKNAFQAHFALKKTAVCLLFFSLFYLSVTLPNGEIQENQRSVNLVLIVYSQIRFTNLK